MSFPFHKKRSQVETQIELPDLINDYQVNPENPKKGDDEP